MIMGIFSESIGDKTKIPKSTAHITLKRRFRLINATEKQLTDKLREVDWKSIKIQTKGIQQFSKSGIEHIATSHNLDIENLFQKVTATLHPFSETKDPQREIGYDQEHANAHISINKLLIEPSKALELYGNQQLQIKKFFLIKDSGEEHFEILAKL